MNWERDCEELGSVWVGEGMGRGLRKMDEEGEDLDNWGMIV